MSFAVKLNGKKTTEFAFFQCGFVFKVNEFESSALGERQNENDCSMRVAESIMSFRIISNDLDNVAIRVHHIHKLK